MTVLGRLKDGRLIAKAALSSMKTAAAGGVYTSATITELRLVESILGVNILTSNPSMSVAPQNMGILTNVVGLTVYMSAGGTATGEVTVIGV